MNARLRALMKWEVYHLLRCSEWEGRGEGSFIPGVGWSITIMQPRLTFECSLEDPDGNGV